MAAVVGKYAANKLLKKQMSKFEGKKVNDGEVSTSTLVQRHDGAILTIIATQDPYFALIEDPRKPGKLKKVKKQIPAYIPEKDAEILAAVRRRAYRLDMCLFDLFGIRFGWEAVIGIVPAIGDAIGVFFALLIFKKCCQIEGGLNGSIKMRMILNIAIDFAVGLVPFIGDLADAAFKCNTKNLRLLERELDRKYKPGRRDERDLAGVDKATRRKNRASGIYLPNDPPPATAFEEFSDEEDNRRDAATDRVREPQPARTRDDGVGRQESRRTGDVSREQPQRTRANDADRQPTKKGYGWFTSGDRSGSRREAPRTDMSERR